MQKYYKIATMQDISQLFLRGSSGQCLIKQTPLFLYPAQALLSAIIVIILDYKNSVSPGI